MVKIKVKGHEIEAIAVKDSFNRRSVQFQNKIIQSICKLGLTVDDIDIDLEKNALKKAPASVSWYFDGQHLHYSNNSMNKFVENMYVVFKVVDLYINLLIEKKITEQDFINEFSEEKDVSKQRKEARKTLGLDPEESDMKVIDKAYKDLAKVHHPDAEGGDTEKFKEINRAHKMIKRELM